MLGVLLTAVIARRGDLPAGELIRHALFTQETILLAVVLAVAAIAALLTALLTSRVTVGGRSFTAFDMAAVAAVAALVLLLTGDVGGATLLVPGLALFVAAYVTARVLAPLTRTLQRLLSHSAFPLRLASLSIARSPGQAVVAAAFLVVSVGLAVFALLYVTTLRSGIDEQAAYSVPQDFLVQEKLAPGGLVAPLERGGVDRYQALAPGTRRDAGDPPRRQHLERSAARTSSRCSACRRTNCSGSTAGATTSRPRPRPRSPAGSRRAARRGCVAIDGPARRVGPRRCRSA